MFKIKLCETIIEMDNKKILRRSKYPNIAIPYIISIVFTFVNFIVKYNSTTYLLPKTINM